MTHDDTKNRKSRLFKIEREVNKTFVWEDCQRDDLHFILKKLEQYVKQSKMKRVTTEMGRM